MIKKTKKVFIVAVQGQNQASGLGLGYVFLCYQGLLL